MQVKKRILTTIVALAVITLGLVGGVTVPSLLSIRDITLRIDEEREKLDTRYALRIFMRDAETKMTDVNARLRSLSGMAVAEGQELAFITALEDAANADGVTQSISLVTANQRDVSTWEKDIPVTLTLSGTYPDVLKYLRHLEHLPYVIIITAIDVDATRRVGPELARGMVDATVSGVIRWHAKTSPAFVR